MRVFEHPRAGASRGEVLALRVHVRQADLNRGELVAADPPAQDLVAPRAHIPSPAIGVRNERDRERELVGADEEPHAPAATFEPMRFIVGTDEAREGPPVRHGIA